MTYGVSMGSGPARWAGERRWYRRGPRSTYRKLKSIQFLLTRDRAAVRRFLTARYPFDLPRSARLGMLREFVRITNAVRGYHTLEEILTVCDRIFQRADGRSIVVVECGAGSGSSTAKLSLATRLVGGRLAVFDTFRGIPENDEQHHLLDGRALTFRPGAFRGRLGAVQRRVEEYGAIEVCEFQKGLVQDTLPEFTSQPDVVLLDVDLVSSTESCLRNLYPQLKPDGVILSQDGHLRATVDLVSDESFWTQLGASPTKIVGLGADKLLEIYR